MYACLWQSNGITPLYVASQNGHVDAVKALVRAGAVVNQAMVRTGGLNMPCTESEPVCVCMRVHVLSCVDDRLAVRESGSNEMHAVVLGQ